MSAYKFTQRAVASPDAPQKPLVRKRARSGGVRWVQVHEPGSQAKKPRTAGSQQPACDQHKNPVLIRDHKIKGLDFGTTPDEGNLSPHPGFAWMKAGYSESIEWRNVRLTKQQGTASPLSGATSGSPNSGMSTSQQMVFGECL